jgi:uncharacterized membrane protein
MVYASAVAAIALYNILKLFHMLTAVILVGGIISRQVVRAYARNGDDVQRFAWLSRAASELENRLVKPGSLLILIFGVLLAWQGEWPIVGIFQGSDQNWLLVSNVLFVSAFAMVPAVFVPAGKRFRPVLDAALASGRITAELRAAMNDRLVRAAHGYELVALLTIFVLMIVKPF